MMLVLIISVCLLVTYLGYAYYLLWRKKSSKISSHNGAYLSSTLHNQGYVEWKSLLKDEGLPCGIIDLSGLDENIYAINQLLGEGRNQKFVLRLASKSIRCPDILSYILEKIPANNGLMCYSLDEIEFLIEYMQGCATNSLSTSSIMALNAKSKKSTVTNYLLAYPTIQSCDIRKFYDITQKYRDTNIILMIDSKDHLKLILKSLDEMTLSLPSSSSSSSSSASSSSRLVKPLQLALDIDMSLRYFNGLLHFGVRRSPLRSIKDILELFQIVSTASYASKLRISGLMGYEAQIAGLSDRNPFKLLLNPIFSFIRQQSLKDVMKRREEIMRAITSSGYSIEFFNGGGSGSFDYCLKEPWLTEITAGSGFFCSHLFDYYSNISFIPSCFYALQICRKSDADYITCLGGGYIASGSPGFEKLPIPHSPIHLQYDANEGCGEVQTPLITTNCTERHQLNLGDPVIFRHAKAGEIAERFNEFLLVRDKKIIGKAKTYRGFGKCFF